MKKLAITFENQKQIERLFELTNWKHNINGGGNYPDSKLYSFDVFGKEFGRTRMYLGLPHNYTVLSFNAFMDFYKSDQNIEQFVEFKSTTV